MSEWMTDCLWLWLGFMVERGRESREVDVREDDLYKLHYYQHGWEKHKLDQGVSLRECALERVDTEHYRISCKSLPPASCSAFPLL